MSRTGRFRTALAGKCHWSERRHDGHYHHGLVRDLAEDQRQLPRARFAVLQPTLENDVPLIRAAAQADVPLRTAQRWLARYRHDDWSALPVLVGATRATAACPPIS